MTSKPGMSRLDRVLAVLLLAGCGGQTTASGARDTGPADALADSQLTDRVDDVEASDIAPDRGLDAPTADGATTDDAGALDSGYDVALDTGEADDAATDDAGALDSGYDAETDTAEGDVDATETGAEVTESGIDASDAGADVAATECSPGETRTCNARMTGCPGSSQDCYSNGTWSPCWCKVCTIPLEPGLCSWTLGPFDAYLDFFHPSLTVVPITVRTIHAEGGTNTIPFVGRTESGCSQDGGWYVLEELGDFGGQLPIASQVFVLCEASCVLHQQNPELVFELFLGQCGFHL
jgi:hypothetical protein